ncbi:phage tail assembly chaperone [Megasphaera sueciensis]|uniref:phage tail assembly chaperone n=1 Tax=Megasphaera sueciensis TaxID=349094 RepID=UPI003CFC7F9F
MSKQSENTKIITVKGRKFVISKLDAFTGSYLLFFILEKFMPSGMEAQLGEEITSKLPSNRQMMTKKEFMSIQRDCLSAVSEILPSGTFPLFNDNGSWRVAETEHDTFLVMILTVQSLMFNVIDFFSEDGLKELKETFQGSLLSSLPMFHHSSTPQ